MKQSTRDKIDNIYIERYVDGDEDVIIVLKEDDLVKILEQAINITGCSLELKDENTPKYGTKEWLKMARKIFRDG